MSEEAYQEGWRDNNPMEDIRLFRTQIALTEVFGKEAKKGQINQQELIKAAVALCQDKHKHTPDAATVTAAMEWLVRTGQFARDKANPDVILKGHRF